MFNDKVITWCSNEYLETIYDTLRKDHYSKTNMRLRNNYGPEHMKEVSAKTIYWNKNSQPEIVCSILQRECWPSDCYRILNRLWKPEPLSGPTFEMSEGFSKVIVDQMNWCLSRGAVGVFMSREGPGNWQKWAREKIEESTKINFEIIDKRFLTCDNDKDNSCWQKIIFAGNKEVLRKWKQKNHD